MNDEYKQMALIGSTILVIVVVGVAGYWFTAVKEGTIITSEATVYRAGDIAIIKVELTSGGIRANPQAVAETIDSLERAGYTYRYSFVCSDGQLFTSYLVYSR